MRGTFDEYRCATFLEESGIADELDVVAGALFGMQQMERPWSGSPAQRGSGKVGSQAGLTCQRIRIRANPDEVATHQPAQ